MAKRLGWIVLRDDAPMAWQEPGGFFDPGSLFVHRSARGWPQSESAHVFASASAARRAVADECRRFGVDADTFTLLPVVGEDR